MEFWGTAREADGLRGMYKGMVGAKTRGVPVSLPGHVVTAIEPHDVADLTTAEAHDSRPLPDTQFKDPIAHIFVKVAAAGWQFAGVKGRVPETGPSPATGGLDLLPREALCLLEASDQSLDLLAPPLVSTVPPVLACPLE